jgi:predicted dehydrogenase/threonine dehydrogenase-like Zn-dependent dehydrogenase
MKQVLQNSRTGELKIADLPDPVVGVGQVLIRNAFSVISPGTERTALSFARKSMPEKARSRPDLVQQVTDKLVREGPLPTYRAVMNRLDVPQPLGYSSSGTVVDVGHGVEGFAIGDRVACGGAGYANHAEIVAVPANLVARVPDGVDLESAAYATLGAIAIQAVRIAEPLIGDFAAVIGLGLVGQLEVQLLRANGCRVLGTDLNPSRVAQAITQGAEWAFASDAIPPNWINDMTGGFGVDFAVVAASSTSAAPLELAADLCRLKGRISIVGDVPIQIDRRAVFAKELDLRMSMSYGPGRYDHSYEEMGRDYPLPYVRWTENRNMQAVLSLLASDAISMKRLGAEKVAFKEALQVYEDLAENRTSALAVVFEYEAASAPQVRVSLDGGRGTSNPNEERLSIGVLGAGNYAKAVLLPELREREGIEKKLIVTATGASAEHAANRFGFGACSTDAEEILGDPEVDLVVIATRHDSHADLAVRALEAGKAVWLEKPVGLDYEQVKRVLEAAERKKAYLFVGYNRRFSSHARKLHSLFLRRTGSLSIQYQVAAGTPPAGSWIMERGVGGGRIVGEVCHFVDLCTYLVGSPPRSVYARSVGSTGANDDSAVLMLEYPDQSIATISYLARSAPGLAKERIEISADGQTAICDNFRSTRIQGGKTFRTYNQDKGQHFAMEEVLSGLKSGRRSPFTFFEIESTSRVTFATLESIESGRAVMLNTWEPSPESDR